jgi:hypothetical protein
MASQFKNTRDATRQPHAKRASCSRRAARREKSTRLFLALAFPADLSMFEGRA